MIQATTDAPVRTAGEAAPDETLIARARSGDPSAREELFRRHFAVAYRVAYRLLGHEQDALDAVQDGMTKAVVHLGEFDGRSKFQTWLLRIVTNASLDAGRRRSRRDRQGRSLDALRAEGTEPAAEEADPAHGLHRNDLRRILDAALARLSPTLRVTFVLFAESGSSYKDIAEIQNIPMGTVMSRLHQARAKLQDFLREAGVDDTFFEVDRS